MTNTHDAMTDAAGMELYCQLSGFPRRPVPSWRDLPEGTRARYRADAKKIVEAALRAEWKDQHA